MSKAEEKLRLMFWNDVSAFCCDTMAHSLAQFFFRGNVRGRSPGQRLVMEICDTLVKNYVRDVSTIDIHGLENWVQLMAACQP